MSRDMSKKQFDAALKRHGMAYTGFLGYVRVYGREGGGSSHVHPANAGPNRRAQLAYLLRAKEKAEAEYAAILKKAGVS